MKDITNFTRQNHDRQIDEVLRRLASVNPAPGIEDRVKTRLASAGAENSRHAESRPVRPWGLSRLLFATAAAAAACVAIVAGSVDHSRRILPAVPGIQLPAGSSSGIGAASAAHVATQQVAPSPNGRARSMRKTINGRAMISPEAQRPAGIAVPKNPVPQSTTDAQQ